MTNNSIVRFVKNNQEFQEEILTKPDLIYLSDNTDLKNFWHNQLADGALSRRGFSLFISEFEFFLVCQGFRQKLILHFQNFEQCHEC